MFKNLVCLILLCVPFSNSEIEIYWDEDLIENEIDVYEYNQEETPREETETREEINPIYWIKNIYPKTWN